MAVATCKAGQLDIQNNKLTLFEMLREHSWKRWVERGRLARLLPENDRRRATWYCQGGHNLDTHNESIVPKLFLHTDTKFLKE